MMTGLPEDVNLRLHLQYTYPMASLPQKSNICRKNEVYHSFVFLRYLTCVVFCRDPTAIPPRAPEFSPFKK